MKKTSLFLAIITALLLSACGSGASESVTETVSETSESTAETTETTVSEAEVSEEVTSETALSETAAADDVNEMPEVFPADEKYEYYPLQLIYPEKQETDITAEVVEIAENFCNADGYCIVEFSAKYPVFGSESVDGAVLDKINSDIKAYIDRIYQEECTEADKFTDDEDIDFFESSFYEMCGFVWQRKVSYDIGYSECAGYDIYGNILSVNFVDYYYGAGAAHGMEAPEVMMFDLQTGERINIVQFIGDTEGFDKKVRCKSMEHGNPAPLTNDEEVIAMYEDFVGYNSDDETVQSEDDASEEDSGNCRYSVKNGCICYYLAPYEYGCYADGIRCVEMTIDEVLPYMNDEGKALFEGVASATTEPVDVISYKGNEYLSTSESVPYEVFSGRELTEGDYEFMALFTDTDYIYFEGCRNIDFSRLAEMKNIKSLRFADCEFDDISPLFGSNINYIYDNGYNISKEQAEEFAEKNGGTVYPERKE